MPKPIIETQKDDRNPFTDVPEPSVQCLTECLYALLLQVPYLYIRRKNQFTYNIFLKQFTKIMNQKTFDRVRYSSLLFLPYINTVTSRFSINYAFKREVVSNVKRAEKIVNGSSFIMPTLITPKGHFTTVINGTLFDPYGSFQKFGDQVKYTNFLEPEGVDILDLSTNSKTESIIKDVADWLSKIVPAEYPILTLEKTA